MISFIANILHIRAMVKAANPKTQVAHQSVFTHLIHVGLIFIIIFFVYHTEYFKFHYIYY